MKQPWIGWPSICLPDASLGTAAQAQLMLFVSTLLQTLAYRSAQLAHFLASSVPPLCTLSKHLLSNSILSKTLPVQNACMQLCKSGHIQLCPQSVGQLAYASLCSHNSLFALTKQAVGHRLLCVWHGCGNHCLHLLRRVCQ